MYLAQVEVLVLRPGEAIPDPDPNLAEAQTGAGNSDIGIIVGGVVAIVAILALTGLAVFLIRRKHSHRGQCRVPTAISIAFTVNTL